GPGPGWRTGARADGWTFPHLAQATRAWSRPLKPFPPKADLQGDRDQPRSSWAKDFVGPIRRRNLMKRQVLPLGAVILSMALCARAASAGTGPVTFGLGGGITMPTNGTGDALKNGFHLRGLAEFHVPALPFGLRGALGYQKMNLQDIVQSAAGITN